MQKRILILTVALVCLALTVPALAKPFTGGSVTIEVPDGWKSMYNAPTMQTMAASPDESCVASIQVMPSSGQSPEDFAQLLSKNMQGAQPQKIENGKGYTFTAVTSGTPVVVTLTTSKNKAAVFVEVGDKEKFSGEIKTIRDSMHSDAADEQELLDILK